ncbi:cytochrome c biogenesis CcdA family protein [Sellimonas sp.]|uniref:cytochrome c biogenesis CcdA family protein n=1 Tax=Sellimonas sp. TaxID=2021466 RepID=UPI00257A47FF|nr:cytochrome c biogenesis protein CcdA [Sellimonas sp.]
MQYFVTFLEGLITFISPCLLPMLPIYLSYMAGEEAASGKTRRLGAFTNAVGFVLGFTFMFLLMGAFAGSIGMLLSRYQTVVNVISGLLVVCFGLSFLGVWKLSFLTGIKDGKFLSEKMSFFSSLLFGIIFSVGWTPCVGAFLGSALMLASQQGSVFKGIFLLLCYSAGLGIPFLLSAVLIHQLNTAISWIGRHHQVINRISGFLLIFVGILMMTGLFGNLLTILS